MKTRTTKISSSDFRVWPKESVNLNKCATLAEPKFWKSYMKVYEECLNTTSTPESPWYIVPADDKENARLIVSRIVIDAFSESELLYPKTTPKRKRELQSIRKLLNKES